MQLGSPAVRTSENSFTDGVFGGDIQLRNDFNWGQSAHQLTYGVDVSDTFNARPRDRPSIGTRSMPSSQGTGHRLSGGLTRFQG